MFATPFPCKMIRASSFVVVECQPTLSPGFNLTEPPRIPPVCGLPFNSGQSPPLQFNTNVFGSGLELWARTTPTTNRPNATDTTTHFSRLNELSLLSVACSGSEVREGLACFRHELPIVACGMQSQFENSERIGLSHFTVGLRSCETSV